MNIFDRTLKIIARNYADSFLRLAFPTKNARLIGTLDNVEISLSVKPVDFVHEILYEGEHYTFHLEFQLKHQADLPQRIFITSAELTEQFNRPTLTTVIYLKPRKAEIPHRYTVKLGDRVINSFDYPVIKLWDYVEQIRQGQFREFAPLLPLLVKNPDELLLSEERSLILQETDDKKRADLLSTAVTIASRYFEKEFLWRFFREELDQMKHATFIEDWLEEKLQEGYEKGQLIGLELGLRQGIEQGVVKGQSQTIRTNIVRVLLNRFNPLARSLKQVEQHLDLINDLSTLEELFDLSLSIDSMEAFGEKVITTISHQKGE